MMNTKFRVVNMGGSKQVVNMGGSKQGGRKIDEGRICKQMQVIYDG